MDLQLSLSNLRLSSYAIYRFPSTPPFASPSRHRLPPFSRFLGYFVIVLFPENFGDTKAKVIAKEYIFLHVRCGWAYVSFFLLFSAIHDCARVCMKSREFCPDDPWSRLFIVSVQTRLKRRFFHFRSPE